MTIKRLDHVSVVVEDLEAARACFTELGMPVEGPWVDRVNGLEGVQVDIVMMWTPDGHGRLESDEVSQSKTGRDRTGKRTRLCYMRGPAGIIVALAEELSRNNDKYLLTNDKPLDRVAM